MPPKRKPRKPSTPRKPRKPSTPRKPLDANIISEIVKKANIKTAGALSGIDKTTRQTAKSEFNKRMPNTNISQHTKETLVSKIWYIFTVLYGGDNPVWTDDVFTYFHIIGSGPSYNDNPRYHDAFKQFDGKRGFLEFMRRLSKEKVFGLYSWLNGRYFDYYRARSWVDNANDIQVELRKTTNVLQRPPPDIMHKYAATNAI